MLAKRELLTSNLVEAILHQNEMGGWVGTLLATTALEGLLNPRKKAYEETTVRKINI